MNREKDKYIEILKNIKRINFPENSSYEFEKPEDVVTSNIGHGDIINQINNIGHNINDKVDDSTGVTHQKLDKIVDFLQSFSNKETFKENEKSSDNYYGVLNEIKDIKTENKITNSRIDNTNKINTIIGSVIGLLISALGLVLTVFIFASNSQYNAIKDMNSSGLQSIQTEIKAINQRLDYQEKLNTLNIQNQVKNEIKNSYKK